MSKETVDKETRLELGYTQMKALRLQSELQLRDQRVKTLEAEIALAQEKIARYKKEIEELQPIQAAEQAKASQLREELIKKYNLQGADRWITETGEIERAPKTN